MQEYAIIINNRRCLNRILNAKKINATQIPRLAIKAKGTYTDFDRNLSLLMITAESRIGLPARNTIGFSHFIVGVTLPCFT